MAAQRRFLSLGFMLSLMLPLLVPATPSWAGVDCGQTIGPYEKAYLTKDLECPDHNPALTLVGPKAVLNLRGHTVDCVNRVRDGIQVNGGGSIVRYGTVTNCSTGVSLNGNGRNKVTKVTATKSTIGFFIHPGSEGNELSYNIARENIVIGFVSQGNGNTLKHNLARDNRSLGFDVELANYNTLLKNQSISNAPSSGFEIEGKGHKLVGNLARDNGDAGFSLIRAQDISLLQNKAVGHPRDGFRFFGTSNVTVLGNTAIQNQEYGIRLVAGAINSKIVGNVSWRNTLADLRDDNVDCDNNTWKFNWFKTSETNPPNAGCIR